MSSLNKKVKYSIRKLAQLSGAKSSVYTVFLEDENTTLFERFIYENQRDYAEEIKDIVGRIRAMGHTVGAREMFFKLKEGRPGDLVCALFDEPDHKLRLYSIRYGKCCIILGGGGFKSPGIKAWQEDEKLTLEAQFMIQVSADILTKLKEGDLKWSDDGFDLIGDLNFNQEEDEI